MLTIFIVFILLLIVLILLLVISGSIFGIVLWRVWLILIVTLSLILICFNIWSFMWLLFNSFLFSHYFICYPIFVLILAPGIALSIHFYFNIAAIFIVIFILIKYNIRIFNFLLRFLIEIPFSWLNSTLGILSWSYYICLALTMCSKSSSSSSASSTLRAFKAM